MGAQSIPEDARRGPRLPHVRAMTVPGQRRRSRRWSRRRIVRRRRRGMDVRRVRPPRGCDPVAGRRRASNRPPSSNDGRTRAARPSTPACDRPLWPTLSPEPGGQPRSPPPSPSISASWSEISGRRASITSHNRGFTRTSGDRPVDRRYRGGGGHITGATRCRAGRARRQLGPRARPIGEIVRQAACPAIALLETDDHAFITEAAKRGVFADPTSAEADQLQDSLAIVLRRFAEFQNLEGRGRRALIERAKGILMERHASTKTVPSRCCAPMHATPTASSRRSPTPSWTGIDSSPATPTLSTPPTDACR